MAARILRYHKASDPVLQMVNATRSERALTRSSSSWISAIKEIFLGAGPEFRGKRGSSGRLIRMSQAIILILQKLESAG